MLRSHLCDYGDAYILLRGTITITEGPNDITDENTRADERNKLAIFKNCATFTDCISEINNSQIDSTKYLDVVMPMHNLTECNSSYSKTVLIFLNKYCCILLNGSIIEMNQMTI